MMDHLVFFAYIGPDTMLPIASAIGGIVGLLLMVWQRVVTFVSSTYIRLFRKSASARWLPKER
jgi:hypothetical protein